MLIGFGIAWLNVTWLRRTELILLIFVLLTLSLVDAKIRKIPNQLLLALIVLRLVVLAHGTIFGELTGNDWLGSLIGAVAGWVIFSIPGMFGLSVGWGDVKFAAVSGFYLKIIGMVQAMLVMSLIILVYGLVLVILKKGNFKTAVAYGPALSGGIIVSTLLPLAEHLI
ncbi:MAG: prepilin peptidase [Eubacteriales bacterium]